MINSNLGFVSHRLATVHQLQIDGRTGSQTTDNM